jgi:predicted Zn-dependent protease
VLLVLSCLNAWAHPGFETQLRDIEKLIEANPTDARLYLRRGELYRVHRNWKQAEIDLHHALKLDPEMIVVEQSLGRLMLDSDRPQAAIDPLKRFLKVRPNDTKGLELLSRSYMRTGKHLEAAKSYSATLASVRNGQPRPEYYLERARALREAGPQHLKATLAGLDEGLRALDYPVTLQLYAVEVEMLHQRYDEALKRIDQIASSSARKESWYIRRGEILEKAGRIDAARTEFQKTLTAIAALPASRVRNRAVERLQLSAEAGIKRLDVVAGSTNDPAPIAQQESESE